MITYLYDKIPHILRFAFAFSRAYHFYTHSLSPIRQTQDKTTQCIGFQKNARQNFRSVKRSLQDCAKMWLPHSVEDEKEAGIEMARVMCFGMG